MDSTLRLGIVSDVHIAPDGTGPCHWHNAYDFAGTIDRLRDAIERFNDEQVDGVLVLGDASHFGDDASLAAAMACLASASSPVWLASGNHDLTTRPDASAHALGKLGTSAIRLAAEEGETLREGVRLAVLRIARSDGSSSCASQAGIPSEVWDEHLTLVASHYPLISRSAELSELGFAYAGDLIDREELLEELLARAAPTVVLSGHLHIRDSCALGHVLQLYFPALIEHPFECSIVELADHEGTPQLSRVAIPLHDERANRHPIFVPAIESWTYDGSGWLASLGSPTRPTLGSVAA